MRGIVAFCALLSVSGLSHAELLVAEDETIIARGSEAVTHTFTELAPHGEVRLSFDLYIFDSWDRSNPEQDIYRTDRLVMQVNGVEIFNYWSFAEWNEASSFEYGAYNEYDNWGPIDRYYADLNGGYVFTSIGDSFTFTIEGIGLSGQSWVDENGRAVTYDTGRRGYVDESWAITNLSIMTAGEPVAQQGGASSVNNVSAPAVASLSGLLLLLGARRVRQGITPQ